MATTTLPQNLSNPTMTGQIQKRARGHIKRAAKKASREILALFERIPRKRIYADTGVILNSNLPDDHWIYVNQTITYEYQLSAQVLASLSRSIDDILREAYLGTTAENALSDWFMYSVTDDAYEQGTAMAVANLSNISTEYTRSLIDVVTSAAYIDRVALVKARVFENMRGLTEQSRADLADTLARGMAAGLNPREIAKDISTRVGVSESRALRIARTEILGASRRARRAEGEDARTRLGFPIKYLWLSALSPTTRPHHADRNGNTYTAQEIEEFYSHSGNGINCKCSSSEVLVDESGEMLDKKLQERLQAKGDKFFKAHVVK